MHDHARGSMVRSYIFLRVCLLECFLGFRKRLIRVKLRHLSRRICALRSLALICRIKIYFFNCKKIFSSAATDYLSILLATVNPHSRRLQGCKQMIHEHLAFGKEGHKPLVLRLVVHRILFVYGGIRIFAEFDVKHRNNCFASLAKHILQEQEFRVYHYSLQFCGQGTGSSPK